MFKTLKKIKEEAFPEGSRVVPLTFDKRVQTRNISRGVITQKNINEMLTKLPDESAHCVAIDYQKITGDDAAADTDVDSGSAH